MLSIGVNVGKGKGKADVTADKDVGTVVGMEMLVELGKEV